MRNVDFSSPLPPVKHCGRYLTGHDLHFIRVKLSWQEMPWQRVEKIEMDQDFAVFVVDGNIFRGWNHDPDYLRALIASGRPVRWCETYRLLSFVDEGGHCYRHVGIDTVASPEACTGDRTDGLYFKVAK